jgi:hypothetical protein
MGMKYTSFVCPVVIAVLLIWAALRRQSPWRTTLRAVVVFSLVTALVAAPWYLKNWIFTGNPIYPFLFGGRFWDDFRAAWYAQAGTGIGIDVIQWITLPWMATLGLRDMNYYDGRMGPLFLALLPLVALYAWRRRRGTAARPLTGMLPLGAFAAVQYTFWMGGVISTRSLWQSRLLLPAFAALSPVLALALDDVRDLDRPNFSPHRFIHMTIAIVLALNVVYQGLDVLRVDPMPFLVGQETRSEFLRRNLGAHYQAMEIINTELPQDVKVLFLWEPRGYYCQRTVTPDPILERWALLRYRFGTVEAIASTLRQEGYTHVLLYRAGMNKVVQNQWTPTGPADVAAWAAFEAGDLTEIYADDARTYILYKLRP